MQSVSGLTELNKYIANLPNLPKLKSINDAYNRPRAVDCIAAVVIPVHNEEQTIAKTLSSIEQQEQSAEGSFEAILVVNNTSDNTLAEIHTFLGTPDLHNNYIVIEETFSPEIAGVGAARKLGCDFAIYRNYIANLPKEAFYLIWLDADNWELPRDYIKETVRVFQTSGADAAVARISFDYDKLSAQYPAVNVLYSFKKAFQSVLDMYGLSRQTQDDKIIHTSGASSSFTQEIYLKIGGVPENKKTSEDTYMGDKIRELGGKIARVERTVIINPRRMLVNPIAWYDNTAWKADVFEQTSKLARGSTFSPRVPSKAELEKLLDTKINRFAEVLSAKKGTDKTAIAAELKAAFYTKLKELELEL